MKKRAIFLLLLFCTVSCHKVVVTNTPPGVSAKAVAEWYEATGALQTISELSLSGVKILKTLHDGGLIEDEYYFKTLQAFINIGQDGLKAVIVLKQVPNNFNSSLKAQVSIFIQSILIEMQNITIAGQTIKNPSSVKAVTSIIASISIAVQLIQSLTGGSN